jgi:hypothetical protein
MPALLLELFGNRLGQLVGCRSVDGFVAEAAHAIELSPFEPIQQQSEVFLRLAREPDDEGRPDGEVRAGLAPAGDAVQRLLLSAGRRMRRRTAGLACWNGMSRYGRTLPSAISGMTASTCG